MKKKELTSEEKAYEFWLEQIKKNKPEVYYSGVDWMINYWEKKRDKKF